MVNLVLRKDVMSLKEATRQVQAWIDVDIHEAADLVYSILKHHDAPIQFWKLPRNGLPFEDTDLATKGYLTEFRESRWWDDDHQREQEEFRRLAGVKYSQRLDKIEDVALLRTDVDKLFAGARKRASERGDGKGDPEFIKSKNMWESATAMPKTRLVSINKLCTALSSHSGEKAPTWEFRSAFSDAYDGDKTMIYRGGTGWSAEPILEGGYYGYNTRADISCDLVNPRHAGDSELDQYLILKEDAELIGNSIWRKFFGNKSWIDTPFFDDLTCEKAATVETTCSDDASKNELASNVSSDHAATVQNEPEKYSSCLPAELDAASINFSAIRNGAPDTYDRWPWGNHHTKLLGHLDAAARRFWVNYDPSDATTAPTNATVSDWLQTEHKVSQTMAGSIASMLRPDGLPTGPRKQLSDPRKANMGAAFQGRPG